MVRHAEQVPARLTGTDDDLELEPLAQVETGPGKSLPGEPVARRVVAEDLRSPDRLSS